MKKTSVLFLIYLNFSFALLAQDLSTEKQAVIHLLDKTAPRYHQIAEKIWNWSELGFLEEKSTRLLQETLIKEGFKVQSGVAGMPTAFVAEWSQGVGGPVLGMLAEFDALPDMSQTATPHRQPDEGRSNGHACGHHLFGAGSVAAAIHTKKWLSSSGTAGTIRLYGTPAEEGGGGKVYMVRAGLFDDLDAVLSWHPGDKNQAIAGSSLAAISIRFRFHGKAMHASGAPWRGRSALDAVEAMNFMVNLMREHVTPETRIHYAILDGSKAPNIVPAYAESAYIVRHPDMRECRSVLDRVIKTAKAAAMGTETQLDYEIVTGYYNKLPNKALAKVMYENLKLVGGVHYNEDETTFATEIMGTLMGSEASIEDAENIQPFEVIEVGKGGSTDVGDISWVRPTTGLRTATWVPGTGAHSWQAVAAGGMSIGHKGMLVAAKTLTLTAMDLYQNPNKLKEAETEIVERRGADFEYEALLGDREPPLDYRVSKQ